MHRAIERAACLVNLDTLLAGAWEKHAVNLVTIGAINEEVLPIERLHQNELRLVKAPEDNIVRAEATPFLQTSVNAILQIFC